MSNPCRACDGSGIDSSIRVGDCTCAECRGTGMGRPSDPIASLVYDLARDGRPSLQWLVEWTARAGSEDPVKAAWDASTETFAMSDLLMGTGDNFGHYCGPTWKPLWNGHKRWSAEIAAMVASERVKSLKPGEPVPCDVARAFIDPPTINDLFANAAELHLQMHGGEGI